MRQVYIGLMFVLMGCTTSPKSDAVLIFDQTEKREPLNENSLFSIYRNISHGQITMTEIRDQSISKSTVIVKEESPSYFLRVESEQHEKELKFEKDFINGLQLYDVPNQELSKSYVYSVFAEHLYKLMESNADRKSILAFSDSFENAEFSFYKYRKNPLKIRDDYQNIVAELEKHDPRIKDADLSGIVISVVFHPSKKDDSLFREVRQFWTRYYESKNAGIEFVTSLENSSLIQGL
ncbi:hypothetical protein ACSIGC_08110 [Tenacibaculum sp. ZS6-P6]|uniref:hypothetical protein n=1 Tax=Tenacibaculum sp. ZS6-P6 TaxID=3447503 RepID=UPI003F9679B2